MDEYVPRRPRCLGRLQQTPFPYTEAIYRTILAEIFPSGLRRPCVHDFTGWSARLCGLPRTDPTASITPLQSLVPVTLVCETNLSDRACPTGSSRLDGKQRSARDLSDPQPTFARRACVMATAISRGLARLAAPLVHNRDSSPSCEPDGGLIRRISPFTHSRKMG